MTVYGLWIRKFLKDRNGVFGLIILVALVVTALFGSYMAPYKDSVYGISPKNRLEPPSLKHIFGTDHMGRDIFSRIICGARITIIISGLATACALLMGLLWGLIAGYYESWIGMIFMRIADIFISLPAIVMALVISVALGAGIGNAILALSITYWPFWTRVVYANILYVKKSPFIEATKASGAGTLRILFLHILPNIAPAVIVRTTIGLGGTILTAAVLSYVGLGAQPPTPDWGLDLASSRSYLPTAWWYALFPGLAIFFTVMAFNMFGDTLRDILDPRLRISGQEE
jgi:peptide/nickel transport system permease protein